MAILDGGPTTLFACDQVRTGETTKALHANRTDPSGLPGPVRVGLLGIATVMA